MSRQPPAGPSLANPPLPLLASGMGLGGLALVWDAAARHWGWPAAIGDSIGVVAAAVFALLAVAYAVKAVRFPEAVREEIAHPVQVNFLPAISISLILFGTLLPPGTAATWLWGGGAALQLAFVLGIVSSWLRRQLDWTTLNPVWFIPAVGNIIIPVPAAQAGYLEVAWFFFTIGLFFWLILMTLCYYRLIFGPNLPEFLQPTLVILLAPPAVACIAWVALHDGGDPGIVGRLFYYMGLFTFLLLLLHVPKLVRVPFYPSWWAYTFPLAAFTIASFHYTQLYAPAVRWATMGLVFLTTAVIAAVLATTLAVLLRGPRAAG